MAREITYADLDETADALVGDGYGSAEERRMAISVVVRVGKRTADALAERLVKRDAVRFHTKTKTITQRWQAGAKESASFVIPTLA